MTRNWVGCKKTRYIYQEIDYRDWEVYKQSRQADKFNHMYVVIEDYEKNKNKF
jgi:hypothetical protein